MKGKDRNGNKKVLTLKREKREKIRELIIREEARFTETCQKDREGRGAAFLSCLTGWATVL